MKKILILLLFSGLAFSQTRTNLEIFYSLLDSALVTAEGRIPETADARQYTFYFESGEGNQLFYNRAVSEMLAKNFREAPIREADLVFFVDETSVSYGEMFRDGFFGDYYLPREISLKGNYLLKGENIHQAFYLAKTDTVAAESVDQVENEMYPFTKGKVPSEPFFSSFLEPAVAIGTAALVVILFFSIRSK